LITVSVLLIMFLLNLLIWVMNDLLDKKRKLRELKEFDSYQYSYNHFVKNQLHKDHSCFKLIKYILKVKFDNFRDAIQFQLSLCITVNIIHAP
jgi:hypothetical protein